jgi:hypothetical protein
MPERRRLKLGSGLGMVGMSVAASASAAASSALRTAAESEPPAFRVCGRCRKRPSADPALYPKARREWWLCPSCHVALFGR